MDIGYWIIVGLWIFTVILILCRGKIIEQNYRELIESKLKKEILEKHRCQIAQQRLVNETIEEKKQEAQQIENDISARKVVLKALDDNIDSQRKYVDRYVQDVKEEKLKNLEKQIQQEAIAMTREAQAKYNEEVQKMGEQAEQAKVELNKILESISEYQTKQDAINQEILRRRELEEKHDFYRVCLSEDAISDINLLQVTRQNLKKPEIIDKIIYDNYVAKPVLEMIKRVLQNSTCSGIYKITCQETKEIYIGKSTDIKNRWQQHCKTAFNCGTIASSILHRKMQQYGIENFTFELLEKVPKDQLNEREKYYIEFYKTKEVGLNERNG